MESVTNSKSFLLDALILLLKYHYYCCLLLFIDCCGYAVSKLLEKGADPNVSNADGLTLLHKVIYLIYYTVWIHRPLWIPIVRICPLWIPIVRICPLWIPIVRICPLWIPIVCICPHSGTSPTPSKRYLYFR